MSHAVLAASAAHRWMHCPPSAWLALKYKDTGSTYAAEGTAAHALAERMLGYALEDAGYDVSWTRVAPDGSPMPRKLKPTPIPGKIALTPADQDASKQIDAHRTASMDEHIADYVAQVMERVQGAKNPYVLLEQRLRFGDYVPHGYGTGDVVILADDTLEIIDLKYGQGVPVDAHLNPQLMLYGLGAFLTFGQLYEIKTIRVTVIQPRLDSTSSYDISAADLISWADGMVKPAAALAWDGQGEFDAGDWCQFCPAAGDCRARAEKNIELAKEAFKDPDTLRDDEIADLLTQLPEWESWAKAFKERALERALHEGAEYSGFKLVLGRSTRKYKDSKAVIQKLVDADYDIDTISPREPLGVTAMTKVLGKQNFKDLLGDLIYMSTGKPTLVPETDKRKAYVPETAQDAFKDFIESADETEKGD